MLTSLPRFLRCVVLIAWVAECFVDGVNTEEGLLGRKLTIHPISAVFEKFLVENPVQEVNSFLYHHKKVAEFCGLHGSLEDSDSDSIEAVSGCTHDEFYACMEILRKPYLQFFDPGRLKVKPETILEHWFDKENPPKKCKRIENPTMEEFMAFVVRSEPVVITGWAKEWDGLDEWSWDLLLSEIAKEAVAVSVSPNPYFDGPEEASLWDPELPEEYVVARPAQLQVVFENFYQLLMSPYANKDTYFYMQYLPLKLYEKGRLERISRSVNVSFASFLDAQLKLLWLSDGRTKGWIHNDKQENLMAIIAGAKTFRLIPPFPENTEPMRGANLQWKFLKDKINGLPKAEFVRDKTTLSEINAYQAYTAVRLDNPDYEKFPNSRDIDYLECKVNKGEVLYNPAHWWHEVDSHGDDKKMNLGVNWFFHPLYNHIFTNDTVWEPNRHYMHIASKLEEAARKAGKPLTFDLKKLITGIERGLVKDEL